MMPDTRATTMPDESRPMNRAKMTPAEPRPTDLDARRAAQ
jgi:hypothetical protein